MDQDGINISDPNYFSDSLPSTAQYRSKCLETYVSQLVLSDNKRIYRRVFEREELSFLYVDFTFYNKKFDEEDWEASLSFELYLLTEVEPIMLDFAQQIRTIGKNENIVTITDNWGNEEPGKVWQVGKYRYDVWVNGNMAESCIFYIQDYGVVLPSANPYLNVYSLRLFESGEKPVSPGDRHYLSCFRHDATRFVWAEIEFENRLQGQQWMGEFTFCFYNDARMLIAMQNMVVPVSTLGNNKTFRIEAKHGHETQVTWVKDMYTVEVWFLGIKIASTAFEVGDKDRYGSNRLETPQTKQATETEKINNEKSKLPDKSITEGDSLSEENLLAGLNGMVGLEAIRRKLADYIAYVKYNKLRKSRGMEDDGAINLHAVFMGNPGTGKTTVARTLGKIYYQLGLLPRDTVFEADRSSLIGRYIGETAPMTQDVIEKARGGILFIDEAYALSKKHDEKDFGRESLEIILKEMSDGPGDLAVIVAGYPREMKGFLEFNPGLKSRFHNIYEFPDYLPDELLRIAEVKAARKGLIIGHEAYYTLEQILTEEFRRRDLSFGNARLVGSIIESAQLNLGVRIMNMPHPENLDTKTLCTLTREDIGRVSLKPGIRKADLPINEELLSNSLSLLNQLTGIERVKQEIHDLVKLVRYQKEINSNILNTYSLHNVFMGNPGTGKTTVARLMAQIFKALGLLERGHLVEVNRENLVAGHVGQTAIKTKEVVDNAMGGVLFIDEAYSLFSPRGTSDFGNEAVEVILKRMEDDRGQFAVIMAGYTQEMQIFIDSNPGLRSRFDNYILFDDYSSAELVYIARSMLAEKGLTPTQEALELLQKYFELNVQQSDRFFGNARFVRKVIEKATRNQLLRLGSTLPSQRTLEIMQTLTLDDVYEFRGTPDGLQTRPVIGFIKRNKLQ